MTTIKEAARYDHQCDVCLFLGRYEDSDLYYCPRQEIALARYGGKPDDFRAEKSTHPHAQEAKRRAAEIGQNSRHGVDSDTVQIRALETIEK